MNPEERWNVIKYGTIIDDYETKIHGTYFIRQKIYLYENKYYIETWNNGYVIHFKALID